MGLIGRWLSGTLSITAALIGAVLAMQAPALSEHYAAALFQRELEIGRAIDLSLQSARSVYRLETQTEEQVIDFLGQQEPASAQAIGNLVDRREALRTAYDRIDARSPLSRPLVMWRDYAGPTAVTREVLESAIATFKPEVQLSQTAAVYAVVGIALGTLLVQIVLWPFGRFANRRIAPPPPRVRRRY
ncbi:MAG: DUF2937 family protein [Alphaproteobacteria bacterium]|nr:DUF2937 family protein [Alphaproteobacteria bacterium]